MIGCTDVEKVTLATLSMEGEAQIWWEAKERRYLAHNQHVSWEMFKANLSKQFIPKVVRDQKPVDCVHLVHGNVTVEEHESKFTELSRYATHIVADEYERAKKFQQGLAPHILEMIAPFMIEDCTEETERALMIGRTMLRMTVGTGQLQSP